MWTKIVFTCQQIKILLTPSQEQASIQHGENIVNNLIVFRNIPDIM